MNIPKALSDACVWFLRDLEEDIPPNQDWIDYAIGHLSNTEKAEAAAFLDELLDSSLSDQELKDIWFEAEARIGFMDESHYRVIFDEMRRRMKGEVPQLKF